MANAHRKTTCWIAALLLAWALAMGAVAETAVSEIIYLYLPACESCARAVAALDSRALRRGGEEIESPVTVHARGHQRRPGARGRAVRRLWRARGRPHCAVRVLWQRISFRRGRHRVRSWRRRSPRARHLSRTARTRRRQRTARRSRKARRRQARREAMTLAGTIGAGLVAGTEHVRAVDAAVVPVRAARGGEAGEAAGGMLSGGEICLPICSSALCCWTCCSALTRSGCSHWRGMVLTAMGTLADRAQPLGRLAGARRALRAGPQPAAARHARPAAPRHSRTDVAPRAGAGGGAAGA